MKKFTVKDFIDYNGPCFSCNNPINFKIGFLDLETRPDEGYLRPTITSDYTEIDLKITYKNSLKLFIFHRTNKIFSSNKKDLTNYLNNHKLFLSSFCDKCLTRIDSQHLNFDIDNDIVSATNLSTERLMIMDNDNLYQLNSYFMIDGGYSYLTIDKINKVTRLTPFTLQLPLLPKYRFKNKEHFLRKIKTYIIFS